EHVFVAKFAPSGGNSVFTILGGSGMDSARGVAVDSGGNVYVAGNTTSPDFPVRNPFQATNNSHWVAADGSFHYGQNCFVTKLDSTGSLLIYSTYLGGSSGGDWASGIGVDSTGEAFVTGMTLSHDFPTQNAFQATNNGIFNVPNTPNATNAFV